MPITASEIIVDALQADGRRKVTERHTWHDGLVDHVSYRADGGADIEAVMAARVPGLEAGANQAERQNVRGAISGGAAPAPLMANLRHLTKRQVLRQLLQGFLQSKDGHGSIRTAEYIDAQVTNADIDDELNIAKRIIIRNRVAFLIALRVGWDNTQNETTEIP